MKPHYYYAIKWVETGGTVQMRRVTEEDAARWSSFYYKLPRYCVRCDHALVDPEPDCRCMRAMG